MEIERKFLLKKFPPISEYKEYEVEQGYISIDPEVRIRRKTALSGLSKGYTDYKLTVKGDGLLEREEIETTISEEVFEQLKAFIKKPMIQKTYRIYQLGNHTLECSAVDLNLPSAFIYAEIEFESTQEAEAFQWPFQDGAEVTYDQSFKMKQYWKRTRLDTSTQD